MGLEELCRTEAEPTPNRRRTVSDDGEQGVVWSAKWELLSAFMLTLTTNA